MILPMNVLSQMKHFQEASMRWKVPRNVQLNFALFPKQQALLVRDADIQSFQMT